MNKLIGFVMAGAAVLTILAPTALAAEFIAPEKDSGNLTLSSGDKHHNAYVAGGNVFLNSDVTGDLYAAGGTIISEGTVEQDFVVAGGTVTINGKVGGDVRVAGGTLTINSAIGGDLIIAGGTVHLTEKASIGGDLALGGGDVTIDSPIAGNVKIAGGSVTLNSKVGGEVKVMADKSFTIGSKAEVANAIAYQGVSAATINEGAKVGTVDFTMIKDQKGGAAGRAFAGIFTMVFVVKVIGLVLAGLLLMKLFPRSTKNAIVKISDKPWVNLGIGFLALIVAPIAMLVILITFVGFYISALAFLAYGMLIILAALLTCLFTGAWVVRYLTKRTEITIDWQAMLIGTVVVGIVSIIPFIGMLAVFVTVVLVFGALIRMVAGHSKSEQA